MHEAIAPLHERVERRANAQSRVRFEATALARLAITNAKEGLVVFDRAVLARDGARLRTSLGHVLVAIHAPEEGVQALVEMRQRHVDIESQARLKPVELVP